MSHGLDIEMRDSILVLNAATGMEFHVEHTGGGCFVLTASHHSGRRVDIAPSHGHLEASDTAAAFRGGVAWQVTSPDEEGTAASLADAGETIRNLMTKAWR